MPDEVKISELPEDTSPQLANIIPEVEGGVTKRTTLQYLRDLFAAFFLAGTLTTGRIPKATGAQTLGNTNIYNNGTDTGYGTDSPASYIHVKAAAGTLHQRFEDATAGLVLLAGGANGIISGAAAGAGAIRAENDLILSGSGNSQDLLINENGIETLAPTGGSNSPIKFGEVTAITDAAMTAL